MGWVYVVLIGINYDNLSVVLYWFEDYGVNWIFIMNNFLDEFINVIVEDLKFENVLYVGGYWGVYVFIDMGVIWFFLGKSLLVVSIGDIKI